MTIDNGNTMEITNRVADYDEHECCKSALAVFLRSALSHGPVDEMTQRNVASAISDLKEHWNAADDAKKRELAAAVRRLKLERMPDGFGTWFLRHINVAHFFPTLTAVGDGCLNCTGIPILELPPTVQRIGARFANDAKDARKELTALKALNKVSASHFIRHGVLKSLDKLERCDRLREIGDDFCRGGSLRTITFPTSLVTIGNGFMAHVVAAPTTKKDVSPLTIDLSHCTSLSTIGSGFAEGCSAVAVHFPGSLQVIPANCFVDMAALRSVEVSFPLEGAVRQMPRLSTIGDNFLLRARSLTELDLDSFGAVVVIGNNFGRGSGLRRVVMPSTLRTLGSGFCAETKDLGTVDLAGAKTLESIGDDFCLGSGVGEIRLPEDLQRIGANYLSRTKGLKELDMSHLRGSVVLGDGFLSHSSVERIRVPKTLRETPKGFCQNTTGIEDLDLSMCRDLKYIRAGFGADSAIKTLKLPPRVLSIDAGFLQRAYRVRELDLSVLSAAKRLVIGDDFLRMSSVAILVCPRIPLSIGNQFCSKCAALEEVDLSAADGLHIRDGFLLGAGVKSLTLPATLHAIGDDFCSDTTNLEVIDLSKCSRLCTMGKDFGRSSKVIRVFLPQIQAVSQNPGSELKESRPQLRQLPNAFLSHAKTINEIVLSPTLASIGDEFCCNVSSDNLVNVDLSACKALMQVGANFLSGCTGCAHVTMPRGLQEIGKGFCAGTKRIRELSLEHCINLQSIGERFMAQSAIEAVRLPGCVKALGADICDGCQTGCILRIGVETLRVHVDSLNVDRSRAAEHDLVRKLLKVLQRDEDQRTVAQRLLERGDVQLFLNVFDPTSEATANKLRTVGGTRQHLPALPPDSFIVLDTASPDYGLTLLHWAVVLFPDLIKSMHLTTEIVAAQTSRGYSVLHYAVMHGVDGGTMKALLAATSPSIARRIGAGFASSIQFSPLHLAFAYRNYEAAAELLDKDGGYRGDPTEPVGDLEYVPFPVDSYDLGLFEWGRARFSEHLQRQQKDSTRERQEDWTTGPPSLASACLALSAIAASVLAWNTATLPTSQSYGAIDETDDPHDRCTVPVDGSASDSAPELDPAFADDFEDERGSFHEQEVDSSIEDKPQLGATLDSAPSNQGILMGASVNTDNSAEGAVLTNDSVLLRTGNLNATRRPRLQNTTFTLTAVAVGEGSLLGRSDDITPQDVPHATSGFHRRSGASSPIAEPCTPWGATGGPPPKLISSRRSTLIGAIAWHLANHPESRLPLPFSGLDPSDFPDIAVDPGALPVQVRNVLREGRGAAQQIQRAGVFNHRVVLTSSVVASAAAVVAARVATLLRSQSVDPETTQQFEDALASVQRIAQNTSDVFDATFNRVAQRRSDGDPQAIAKAEAHTLRLTAKATLMEITDATDIDVLVAAVDRVCADGVALSLGHASTAQNVEYRLRRFDRAQFTARGDQRHADDQGAEYLPVTVCIDSYVQQLAESLEEVTKQAAKACRIADSATGLISTFHADEVRECQLLVESMETGLYQDKLRDKFDSIVPVLSVWPSFAFFILFIIYLLGGPLVFDQPHASEVTGAIEFSLKLCLGAFPGGVATFRGIRAMNNQFPDPGVTRWVCDVNLTEAILEHVVTTVNPLGRNLTYTVVPASEIPNYPQPDDFQYHFPHALRFSTPVEYLGVEREPARRYWVATEVNGGWPFEYRFWSDLSRNESRIFSRGQNTRNFRHRVIPEYFGKWAISWTNAIWVACSLCCFALLSEIAGTVRLAIMILLPNRFPGKPVQLNSPSMGTLAMNFAFVTVQLIVVAYNFVWCTGFVELIHERRGINAWVSWNTAERFVRASASLKLSTILSAIPAISFARSVPKPNQFHITNAIAAASVLVYLVMAVERGPVFRLEEWFILFQPEMLFSLNSMGPLTLLISFLLALFARRFNSISDGARQWHYDLLYFRRRERKRVLAKNARCAFVPPVLPPATPATKSPFHVKSVSYSESGALLLPAAVNDPFTAAALYEQPKNVMFEEEKHASVAVASSESDAPNGLSHRAKRAFARFQPSYRVWQSLQRLTVLMSCLFQLTLYGVCLYVFVNPTIIDAPYWGVERSPAMSRIMNAIQYRTSLVA
jgi:hypothetical protein